MTIHNKFIHEGTSYVAEPKPYVRIGEALFKVKTTDGDGNATIVASSKKDLAPEDVAIAARADRGLPPETSNGAASAGPETKPEVAPAPAAVKVDLAMLKVQWAKAHDEVERIKAENEARLETATKRLAAAESDIAANLLGRERKRGEAAPAVRLGETRYRAARSRDDGPRLIVVPAAADVE